MSVGGGSGVSTGGGAGRRGGGGGSARSTHITWLEAAITPPAAITAKEGDDTPVITEADQFRRMLHMNDWDPRPTFLYFHVEHGEGPAGDKSEEQCRVMDDETVARWSHLYTFVEVDIDKSNAKLLERFGAGNGPSFAIVNSDLEVMAQSPLLTTPKKVVSFLKTNLKSGFKDYWKNVEERISEQKTLLREAKALEKKKEFDRALTRLQEVASSNLKIAPHWEEAMRDMQRLQAKVNGR